MRSDVLRERSRAPDAGRARAEPHHVSACPGHYADSDTDALARRGILPVVDTGIAFADAIAPADAPTGAFSFKPERRADR